MDIDFEAPEVKQAIDAKAKELADAEAGGLKKKNSELMDEVKAYKSKYDGVDPEEYRKLKDSQRKAGDKDASPEELRKRIEGEFSPQIEKTNERADIAEQKLRNLTIDISLTNAMAEANIGKDFMKAAKALVMSSNKFDVTESGATVDGQPVEAFIKKWVEGEGKAFVAAPANSGGGGQGGGSGAGVKAKTKAHLKTTAEKTAFIKEHGVDAFNALPAE